MKDYYDILQVSRNAEQEVIEAAYRRLARKYHPDVYSGSDAGDRMRELNEAHEVLGDPRRRAEYDAELGRAWTRGGARRQHEGAPPPPPPPPDDQPSGLRANWLAWIEYFRRRAAIAAGAAVVVGIVVALWMTGACDPGATPEDPDETAWGDGYATWSYETKGMRVGCWAKKDLERLCRDLLIIEDIAIHDSPDEYRDTEVVNITLAEDAESGAIVAIKDFDGGAGYGGRSEGGCIERRGEDVGEWDWCDEALESKVLPSPTPAVTPTTRATSFDDPILYCAAVGTIDAPDSRYVGVAMPQAVENAVRERFGLGTTEPGGGTSWRCLDGKLLACTVGANLPCGKASTSREPTSAMVEFCRENPWESYIPKAVTGHSTIYGWDCRGGEPAIAAQEFEVDARGFVADFWYEVEADERANRP
jgi:hypothetical protein